MPFEPEWMNERLTTPQHKIKICPFIIVIIYLFIYLFILFYFNSFFKKLNTDLVLQVYILTYS